MRQLFYCWVLSECCCRGCAGSRYGYILGRAEDGHCLLSLCSGLGKNTEVAATVAVLWLVGWCRPLLPRRRLNLVWLPRLVVVPWPIAILIYITPNTSSVPCTAVADHLCST
jgi:hypothetical protein